jgi:hypothetical protein
MSWFVYITLTYCEGNFNSTIQTDCNKKLSNTKIK